MKFNIDNIHIWLKRNHECLTIDFLPNKVNVITGASNTGKTSILKIIDYCLFAKNNDIPDDVNENAFAYGLSITINDKNILIIRETNGEKGKVSQKYIFLDEIDRFPEYIQPEIFGNYAIPERNIKQFLEKEAH